MVDGVLVNPPIRRTLLAIQDVQSVIDRTTQRLATNKKVNSAFENPNSFFASKALTNRSGDLLRLIDGINRNISVIKETLIGVEALQSLLEQAESIALESQLDLTLGITDPDIYEFELDTTLPPLSSQILADNPDGYWRLNEAAGGVAVNLGAGGAAINGIYQSGVSLGAAGLYENNSDVSADFDGINDRILIPDSPLINNPGTFPQRTVELVFNADDVSAGAGRQVLYEEGGNTNSLNIYIDNGRIYFNTRDAGDFGPFNISAPIVAGQTYHAAVVFDFPGSGTFTGYLDGEEVGQGAVNRALSSHSGNIGIGSLQDSSYMHDGPSPNNTFRFDGRISDVALYNDALSASRINAHARSLNFETEVEFRHAQFEKVLTEIDAIVNDATFQGSSLLQGNDIETIFNEHHTSSLITQGVDFTAFGLDLERNDFNNADNLEEIIESVQLALSFVRNYGTSLVNDLLIMETRLELTQNTVNNLQQGSDKLILADMNAESAKMLASQTRLDLAINSLSVASLFNASILTVFS